MDNISSLSIAGSPEHDVLADVDSYDIAGFSYVATSAPFGMLDLIFKNADSTVVLRFEGVHEFEVDAGFPHGSMGLEIRDVSHLGWENARVRVQETEDGAPAIRLWAREVRRVAA